MPGIDAREFFALPALADPYPLYARMRARGPLCALEGTRAFFVGHHAAVEEAVRRHAEFSANLDAVLVCGEDDVPRLVGFGGRDTASDVIATADEPAHAVHRRLLLPSLKAPRIAALEPAIRSFARERIHTLVRAGGGDWCAALAEPLPAFVVIRLLGLEEGALEAVQRWAMMGGDLLGGRLDAARLQRLLLETGAMHTWLGEHFDRARARPAAGRGETLTATLAGGLDEGAITREEAVGILVVLFGAAGESTASLLGTALALMLRSPELQQQLRAQPALLDAFVEEAVRLESPFKFHYRVVRQASELCGTALLPGDRLLLGWASANRDAAVFVDADALRLDRAHPQRHLGFGYGIHFCIGALLARLEVRVALEELLAQARGIALVDPQKRAFVPSVFVRRLQRLELRLEA